MLDAYIIDRIRREREQEQRDGAFIPLHIEAPRPDQAPPVDPGSDEEPAERGSVVVDYQL